MSSRLSSGMDIDHEHTCGPTANDRQLLATPSLSSTQSVLPSSPFSQAELDWDLDGLDNEQTALIPPLDQGELTPPHKYAASNGSSFEAPTPFTIPFNGQTLYLGETRPENRFEMMATAANKLIEICYEQRSQVQAKRCYHQLCDAERVLREVKYHAYGIEHCRATHKAMTAELRTSLLADLQNAENSQLARLEHWLAGTTAPIEPLDSFIDDEPLAVESFKFHEAQKRCGVYEDILLRPQVELSMRTLNDFSQLEYSLKTWEEQAAPLGALSKRLQGEVKECLNEVGHLKENAPLSCEMCRSEMWGDLDLVSSCIVA